MRTVDFDMFPAVLPRAVRKRGQRDDFVAIAVPASTGSDLSAKSILVSYFITLRAASRILQDSTMML